MANCGAACEPPFVTVWFGSTSAEFADRTVIPSCGLQTDPGLRRDELRTTSGHWRRIETVKYDLPQTWRRNSAG